MDELIGLVSQKTGIPEQTAKVAVETVLGFLKDKLPASIAGQLDAVLEGEDLSNAGGGLLKSLGGILGK